MPTTVTHTVKSSGGDYTSLSAWEAGEQRNLVLADEIEEVVCYGFIDTTNCSISGWTTGVNNYIIVRADASAKSTLPPTTDGSRYLLRVSSGTALSVQQEYTRVYDIQVEHTTDGSNNNAVFVGTTGMLLRNIVARSNNNANVGSAYFSQGGSTPNSRLQNCVGIMINGNGRDTGVFRHDNADTRYDNCLAYTTGIRHGFRPSANDNIVVRNCLAVVGTGAGFSGSGFNTTFSTNNATNKDFAPGENARTNQTFTFVDSASLDFHLAESDTGAKGYGLNLSTSNTASFSDDFDGILRSTVWDIGPFQVTTDFINNFNNITISTTGTGNTFRISQNQIGVFVVGT